MLLGRPSPRELRPRATRNPRAPASRLGVCALMIFPPRSRAAVRPLCVTARDGRLQPVVTERVPRADEIARAPCRAAPSPSRSSAWKCPLNASSQVTVDQMPDIVQQGLGLRYVRYRDSARGGRADPCDARANPRIPSDRECAPASWGRDPSIPPAWTWLTPSQSARRMSALHCARVNPSATACCSKALRVQTRHIPQEEAEASRFLQAAARRPRNQGRTYHNPCYDHN